MTTTKRSDSLEDRVISAAREVFAEQGFAAPMSEVAHRAGVGVASVYRRYPGKEELIEEVRLACLRLISSEAAAARAEEADPWQALTRFLFRCLAANTRIGVVLPPVGESYTYSDWYWQLHDQMVADINAVLSAAQRAGSLREDITWGDVVLLFKHLNPPLWLDELRRAEFRARYLSLVVEGLRAGLPPLPGSAPRRDEMIALHQQPANLQ